MVAEEVEEEWAATWAAAVQLDELDPEGDIRDFFPMPESLDNQTIRMTIRTSIGGDKIRIRLSNAFGPSAVVIDAATIALRDEDGNVVSDTIKPLTFGGSSSIRIPEGGLVVSDDISLKVNALQEMAISLYVAEYTPVDTVHGNGNRTMYVSEPRNYTTVEDFPVAETSASWL